MRITARGTVFDARGAAPDARFCTFPTIAMTGDGRLVAGFRTGSSKDSPDEDVRVMASDDLGATWQTVFEGFGDFPPGAPKSPKGGSGRMRGIALTAFPRPECGEGHTPDASPSLAGTGPEPVEGRRGASTSSASVGPDWPAGRAEGPAADALPSLAGTGPEPVEGPRGASTSSASGAPGTTTSLLASLLWVDHANPTLSLASPDTQGLLPTMVFVSRSSDGGRTWSAPQEVPLAPHVGNATTGPILRLTGGRLALPYEAWKEYDDASPGLHHASLRLSDDGGRTWPGLAIVAHDPAGRVLYWDQRLAVDPTTGGLVAMFWTHDRQVAQDLPMHIAWGSADGQTWTQPVPTGIAGQIAAPVILPDGRLFAAYVHRHHPPSLRAILSEDGGHTWTAAPELIFYEKARGGQESGMGGARDFGDYWADMSIWTFGHPAPLLLPDGDVLVLYYAGDGTTMGVHWVRIAV